MRFTEQVSFEEAFKVFEDYFNEYHPFYGYKNAVGKYRKFIPYNVHDAGYAWEFSTDEVSRRSGRLMCESRWGVSKKDMFADTVYKGIEMTIYGLYYHNVPRKRGGKK